MELRFYVVGVRKLYKDYVQQGQGIAAEEWYRNRCVDLANNRIYLEVLPALGWVPTRVANTKRGPVPVVEGGRDAICSIIRNAIARMMLNLPEHTSYKGFSEAGMRAMDAFYRRAPDGVLVDAAINALADSRVAEDKQESWRKFQQSLADQSAVDLDLARPENQ
jgi:hypothetical protein